MEPDPEARIKVIAAEVELMEIMSVAVAVMNAGALPFNPAAVEKIAIVARAAPEAKRAP